MAYQEPNYWPIRNQAFGLSGTERSKNVNYFKGLVAYPHPVTRARDLNQELTLLTSNPASRLKRGLRPLGASNPPNPPYPQKERPPGEPKTQTLPRRRPAAGGKMKADNGAETR